MLDLDAITEMYHAWASTRPQQHFGKAVIESIGDRAFVAKREAAEVAMGSNAIVRTYPLAIWAARLSTKDLRKVIVSEVELTNKEAVTQEAAFLYGAALRYLLNHPRDPQRFENAFKHALELSKTEMASTVNHKQDSCHNWLQEAFELSQQAEQDPNHGDTASNFLLHRYFCTKNQGFVKHPFVVAFYFVLRCGKMVERHEDYQKIFDKALRETLNLGGDANTNATIVCSLLGAGLGLHGLPRSKIEKVLNFDSSDPKCGGIMRPAWLSIKQNLLSLAYSLLDVSAKEQLVIVEDQGPEPLRKMNCQTTPQTQQQNRDDDEMQVDNEE